MLNRLSFLLSALLLFLLSSCSEENPTAFSFSHDYNGIKVNIDTTSFQGNIALGDYAFNTELLNILADNGVTLENLESVTVTAVELSIEDTSTLAMPYTFDLLGKIQSRIGKAGSSSLTDIAKKDPVPAQGLTTLALDVTPVNLLDYFKASTLKFDLSGSTTAPIQHPFALNAKVTVQFKGEFIKD
jgi:hypothetical protein